MDLAEMIVGLVGGIVSWVLIIYLACSKQRRLRRAADRRRETYYRRWLQARPTDSERQLAIVTIGDAHRLGRIELVEHDRRVAAVLAATRNAEVQRQIEDLEDIDHP
ncbi:DUF1707 domain-containing protein [Streptosporangium sp. NPDC051023]|uniref:DUF1707 SHOCT-like domain-containing protein n=1 Tax=Streptosporangium sp. NPDC051023 TaxID=3155410 RepID=UPI0034502C6E